MPRVLWKGTISFGLVNVAVKLYAALSPKEVRFHQLHAVDHARIQQKRVCSADGEEVPYAEIVKGYEIAPDRYVVVDPEELAAVAPATTHTIEIEDFVAVSEIDPIYFDRPYILVPGEGAVNTYRLLLEAMRRTERVGIARIVLRSKEHLVAIRPRADALIMTTMSFADEVTDPGGLGELSGLGEEKVRKRELDIACSLVDSLARDFDASRYHDTYREAVMELIESKATGEEIVLDSHPETRPTQAPDLMAALQASLEEVRAARRGDPDRPSRPRRAAKGAVAPKAGKAGTSRSTSSSGGATSKRPSRKGA